MNHKITIVADSGSDLLPHEAKELGIELIALTVRFGEEEFLDGETLSRDEFYDKLVNSDQFPKTSLISPQRYQECFEREVEAGNKVICLVLSSGVSGSYQSAVLAAQEFEGEVFVIDTRHFCGSMNILVRRACALRKEGLAAEQIVAAIEKEKNEVCIVALFDTLEYLKKGGRISAAAATVGSLISLKPVMTIADGSVAVIGKARGSKKGNNHLMEYVQDHGGIDWSRPILLSYSGMTDEMLEQYIKDSAVLYEGRKAEDLPRSRVGATIGTYTGPGAIAFSFFAKGE